LSTVSWLAGGFAAGRVFKDNLITPDEAPADVEAPEGPPLI
jgi:hypothetical protein